MKEKFRDKEFGRKIHIKLWEGKYWDADTQELLDRLDFVIDEYQKQGIKLTLRQLYYQLVARGYIPNHDKVYAKLSVLLTDSRYIGRVDWEAIEDRSRAQHKHSEWTDIESLVQSAIYSYRKNRWKGQKYYVELMTEKEALASVLHPITDKWHIRFCIFKGYTSASVMYELFERIKWRLQNTDKKVVILYLGDHDPSGLDMVRDIRERIEEFLTGGDEPIDFDTVSERFVVAPIALTMEQIKKYNPPPNPAKITDPRAKWYISQFGETSWEVDALRPEIMTKIVDDAIRSYIDENKYNEIIEEEDYEKQRLQEFAEELKDEQKDDEDE